MKIISIILLSVLVWSCRKEFDCPPGALNLTLFNCDTTSTDSVIITSFTKNDNFTNIVKSDTFYYNDSILMSGLAKVYGDTITFWGAEGLGVSFAYEYDWLVETKNHQYKLTDFVYKLQTQTRGGILPYEYEQCFSPIVSYKLNQSIVSSISYNTVYLQN